MKNFSALFQLMERHRIAPGLLGAISAFLLLAGAAGATGVRMVEPVVIPAAASLRSDASTDSLPSPALPVASGSVRVGVPPSVSTPVATSAPAPIPASTVPVAAPSILPDAEEMALAVPPPPGFAFASGHARQPVVPETTDSGRDPLALHPGQEEMRVRMRLAVERVAAEYGNPVFAELFTNDPLRARVLRNRLQLLKDYEALTARVVEMEQQRQAVADSVEAAIRQRSALIQTGIADLERQKTMLAAAVDAQRAELKMLQERASALNERILKAQRALAAANP